MNKLLVILVFLVIIIPGCESRVKHNFTYGDIVVHKISSEIGMVVRVYAFYDLIGVRWSGGQEEIPEHMIGSGGPIKKTQMYYYEVHEYEVDRYVKK